LRGVGEEADPAGAFGSVFTGLGTVLGWVEPDFEDSMGELAGIPLLAAALSELWAGDTGVIELPGVPPASFLTRVGKRALGPVVGPGSGAHSDLELVHEELVVVLARKEVELAGVLVGAEKSSPEGG